MAQKPENVMLNRVKKAVEKAYGDHVYIEKMNNPYRSGTPDWYVEAFGGMCWVEGKYRPTKAAPGDSFDTALAAGMLSAHQKRWIARAVRNGRDCYVLVGFDGPSARQHTYAIIEFGPNAEPVWASVVVVEISTIVSWFGL